MDGGREGSDERLECRRTAPPRAQLPRKRPQDWIDAGLRVLAQHGHRGLSLALVVEEVGVTSGSLYSQFGSWGNYRSALVRWWAEHRYRDEFLSAMSDAPDPTEALRRCVQFGIGLDHAGRALRMWAVDEPDLAARVATGDRETVEVIAALLERAGVEQTDASFRAWTLFTAFAGLYSLTPPPDVIADLDRLVAWLLQPGS